MGIRRDRIAAVSDRSAFRYPRVCDYLAALETAPPAVNAVCLAGHTTLRAGALAEHPHRNGV